MGIYRRPTSLAILTIIIVHCARTLYAQQHQPPTESVASVGDGASVIVLKPDANVNAVLAEIQSNNAVDFVEVDQVVSISQANAPDNDPLLPKQWGMFAIRSPAAWTTTRGSPGVRICVVDTGLDASHPDLEANTRSPGSAATFFDGKQRSGAPDDNGHGTHVAGIAAAVGNNNMGVSGVAQAADLWACRFMDSQGNGYLSDATECIKWCTKNGAKIIVASWGGASTKPVALERALQAFGDAGGIFVNAALNFGTNLDESPLYPPSLKLPNMLVVGAVDEQLQRAGYSCYGAATVDVFAPGSNILSTVPVMRCNNAAVGCYQQMSGTSMAAPHVAGQIALLMAEGVCSGAACKAAVVNSVKVMPQLKGLAMHEGMVNVAASLGVAPPAPVAPNPPAPAPRGSSWFGIPVPSWFGDMGDDDAAAAPAESAVNAESVRVAIKQQGGR